MAYNNVDMLTSITEFDPSSGAGGQYRNGKLYVGKRNFTENSSDEDILATIYHEYMHYLNWQFGGRYRMANMETGEVYFINEPCFEEKIQTENEFLQESYDLFIQTQYRTNMDVYADYPLYYKDLNDAQKEEFSLFIRKNELKPKITCFPYPYSPSNYFKDEINAHTETLKANSKSVFKMSNEKIEFYNSETVRYTNAYNKAKTYEINNNINNEGYEN
jgi:hypothetical protein